MKQILIGMTAGKGTSCEKIDASFILLAETSNTALTGITPQQNAYYVVSGWGYVVLKCNVMRCE